MSKVTTSLSLSEELVKKLDKKRDLVTRSAYVEFLLKKLLEEESKNES